MISTKVFEVLVANLEWPSNDGRILVKDMTYSHISNALAKSFLFPDDQPFGGLTTMEWREVFRYELEQREVEASKIAAKIKEEEENRKLAESLRERSVQLELELDNVREQLLELALLDCL